MGATFQYMRCRLLYLFILSSVVLFILTLPRPSTCNSVEWQLPVTEIEQQQSQWCWAAVSQSLLAAYNIEVSQCELAQWVQIIDSETSEATPPHCCTSDAPFETITDCNRFNSFAGEATSVQELLSAYGVDTIPVYGALSASELIERLKEGKPIIVQWATDGLIGHFVIIYGYSTEGQKTWLYYFDPWPGNGVAAATYEWMLANIDSGSDKDSDFHVWIHTLVPLTGTAVACNKEQMCLQSPVLTETVNLPASVPSGRSAQSCTYEPPAARAGPVWSLLF